MKKKIIGVFVAWAGIIYFWMCIICIVSQDYVSPEDYARMAREIVEQNPPEK